MVRMSPESMAAFTVPRIESSLSAPSCSFLAVVPRSPSILESPLRVPDVVSLTSAMVEENLPTSASASLAAPSMVSASLPSDPLRPCS